MALRIKTLREAQELLIDHKGVLKRPRFRVAAKAQRTLDGIEFESASEMRRYAQLRLWERGGAIADLELQPSFPVEINQIRVCTYTADFRYRSLASGKIVVEDVKSDGTIRDPYWKLRVRCAEAFYGFRVEIIKM